MNDILFNIRHIRQRITDACIKSGRNPSEVRLLMATKTVAPDRIITAFESGETLIGENKLQEIKEKYDALKDYSHEQHFIGHLQTNKIKEIIRYNVDCVQSVDRLELAIKLNDRLKRERRNLDILVQVNTSGEASKFGVSPDKAVELVKQIAALDHLHIKGLMTIGLFSDDPEETRPCFTLLSQLRQQIINLNIAGVEMKELSMGMSGDLETAIEEGATIIRVGTAIFGKRVYPDSYYWNEQNPNQS